MRFDVIDIWYIFEFMLLYFCLILCDKLWFRFSKKRDKMFLWYFEECFIYKYYFLVFIIFLLMEGVMVLDIFKFVLK